MIKIEEKELNNIKNKIIKYTKEKKAKKELIEIVELALNVYINEIIMYNINNNNTN